MILRVQSRRRGISVSGANEKELFDVTQVHLRSWSPGSVSTLNAFPFRRSLSILLI